MSATLAKIRRGVIRKVGSGIFKTVLAKLGEHFDESTTSALSTMCRMLHSARMSVIQKTVQTAFVVRQELKRCYTISDQSKGSTQK